MTRAQALTIAILAGLVVLVCMGLVMLMVLPFERIFPSPPTSTPLLPTPTPTPTFPKFIPTASLETVTVEPTATNTRVPTATPRPLRTPTPTVIIQLTLTLPPRKPTPTPKVNTPLPIPTATPTPSVSPSPVSRGYSISFEAEETKIEKGECTNLRWNVEGASSMVLDGESIEATGKKKVCPKFDDSYRLTVKLFDGTQLHRTVKISVEEQAEEE